MSPVKEPFYFSPDVVTGGPKPFRHGQDDASYLDLFSDARGEKSVGEASTMYLVSHVAPSLIKEFEPEARIVAMLRNPVDMIHAMHRHRVSHQREPIVDFEAALAADADRREGRRLPKGTLPLEAVYRDTGRYAEHLTRWFATFGRDRVHVIIFDDFVADTPASFRRLLDFLEVDPDYRPAAFDVHNASHRIRGGARTLLKSRAGRATRRLVRRVVGENTSARLGWRFRHSWLYRRRVTAHALRPELRRALEREFAPDVARLSELLGRDLAALWFGRAARGAVGE